MAAAVAMAMATTAIMAKEVPEPPSDGLWEVTLLPRTWMLSIGLWHSNALFLELIVVYRLPAHSEFGGPKDSKDAHHNEDGNNHNAMMMVMSSFIV